MILGLMIFNVIYFLLLIIYSKQLNIYCLILLALNILIYILNISLLNNLFIILLLLIFMNSIVIHQKGKQSPEGNNKVMIILGYALVHNQMQSLLYNRLNTAYEYYLNHQNILIVVTGGITKGNSISESSIMKKYLIQKGIPESQIYEEDQSEDTYENLVNCEKYAESKNQSMILVTNQFHMKRALMIAGKAGYSHVEGLSAPNNIEFLSNYLREFFAYTIMKIKKQL